MSTNARDVFAHNLQTQLNLTGKTQSDIVRDLGYKQATVSDWVKGKKYPRVDKMQALADYFGILMSDLTEEKHRINNDISDRQRYAFEKFMKLTPEQQKLATDFLDMLLRQQNE